jgi:hypothetical protein
MHLVMIAKFDLPVVMALRKQKVMLMRKLILVLMLNMTLTLTVIHAILLMSIAMPVWIMRFTLVLVLLMILALMLLLHPGSECIDSFQLCRRRLHFTRRRRSVSNSVEIEVELLHTHRQHKPAINLLDPWGRGLDKVMAIIGIINKDAAGKTVVTPTFDCDLDTVVPETEVVTDFRWCRRERQLWHTLHSIGNHEFVYNVNAPRNDNIHFTHNAIRADNLVVPLPQQLLKRQ